MVLAKPNSIAPHTKLTAEIYVLMKEGRTAYAVLRATGRSSAFPDDGRDEGSWTLAPGVEMSVTGR